MLAGTRSGGDVRAYQQLVAARRLAQTPDDGPLLNVLVKTVNTIKIAEAGSPVCSVAFSPDGTRIVSGSADNTVRVWDAATGQPVGQPLTGHTGRGVERGVQPRRHADRLRQCRQHGAGVGRGHRPTRRPAADRPHGRGVQRGVQPRRHADRLRQCRHHGAGVGRGHRPTRRPAADRPHRTGCSAWRSAPTARGSSPAVPTTRCGCGTRPPANPSASR